MTWIEQVIEQRRLHPTASILGPTLALPVVVAEALSNLVEGPIDKGLVFWTTLPRLGRVRVHMVPEQEDAPTEPV